MSSSLNPRKWFQLTVAAALFAGLLAGCGGDEKKAETAGAQPGADGAAKASAAAENGVHITGNDQMQFSLTAFEVESGQEVTLTLENIGKLPKQAMGHNLVILVPGTDVADFAQKALSAADNEYIPEGSDDVIVAHTRLLGPGESDTITFTVPEPGEYPFLCSFPGHYATMQGVMTVK